MPTVKLAISNGISHSASDGCESVSKMHNFTVGTDGSLYKLPAMRNLKNASSEQWTSGSKRLFLPYRFLDIRKFQTSTLNEAIPIPPEYDAENLDIQHMNMFRRFIFLTVGSYGVVNVDYDGNRIFNSDLPSGQKKFGEFEYPVFNYIKDDPADPTVYDLTSLNGKIVVDFNAQYDETVDPAKTMRAVFPTQHMFVSKAVSGFESLIAPRNIVHCSMDATSGEPKISPLEIFNVPDSAREKNDIARGCFLIGNRMWFYSAVDNAIYLSAPNKFTLQAREGATSNAIKITPPEEIQAITDFNGNLIAFTPTGIERWTLTGEEETILSRDPTLHFDHRIRYSGSFVKGNRELFYYTDDFRVYKMNVKLEVEEVFGGTLSVYKPFEEFLVKDHDLPMSYFKMLGFRFISIGPWLFNIDSGVWSTYSFDGWKKPISDFDPDNDTIAWENTTNKRVISTAYDDLICTYSTICKPLTYKEMKDETIFPDTEPSLLEDSHQWGELALFTSETFQDNKYFSVDGIQLFVRGDVLPRGATVWCKLLPGNALGDLDESDESTYGIIGKYEPIDAATIGENQENYVGKFKWEFNLKTDRFRAQFVTKEKRGIIIGAAFANITTPEEAESYNQQKMQMEQPQQQQQQQK